MNLFINDVIIHSSIVNTLAFVSELLNNGIYLKNSDKKIAYSADNSEWIITEISSVFTNDEYKTDILGNVRGRMLGSVAEVCNGVRIIGFDENNAVIYTPADREAVFIGSKEAADGKMTDISVNNIRLDTGTNTVYLGSEYYEKYMLWDSLESITPLCKYYI